MAEGGGLFDSEFSEIRNLNPYEPQRAFSPLQKIPCFEKMTVQLIGNDCKFTILKKKMSMIKALGLIFD